MNLTSGILGGNQKVYFLTSYANMRDCLGIPIANFTSRKTIEIDNELAFTRILDQEVDAAQLSLRVIFLGGVGGPVVGPNDNPGPITVTELYDPKPLSCHCERTTSAINPWQYYDEDPENDPLSLPGIYCDEPLKGDIIYYLYDHLSNTRMTYKVSKSTIDGNLVTGYHVESIFDYDPYGKLMRSYTTTPEGEKYLTTQHERDAETGLDYRGARFYDAEVGRFLSVDPKAADAPDWSPYRAFFCNPIRYTDPDGQWEWDATGNLVAQKGDNSYSMAKFLGTSQSNAMQMLNRGGVTANAKGVLNLKEGQSFAKDNLWVGTKSGSGPVVNTSKEATSHYYNGNGAAVDVGDQATTQLLSSDKFEAKHTKITSEQVQPTGNFSVDLTDQTFHIGRTNVDYSVTNNGTSSSVTYTLFARDGFWDPNFVAEKTLGKVFDRYKPDGKGPNLETPGGTPYDYKTRTRTFFFKPVEEKK